jgi:branched-chain amino acid transport system permease protein
MREGVVTSADVGVTGEPAGSVADEVYAQERKDKRAVYWLALAFFAGSLLFAAIGWARGDVFFLRLGTEALIVGGLAVSVDVLLGFAGLLSLGQALYFGLGAYSSALVLKATASFWLALAIGIGAGLAGGLIGGVIAARVRGVYFALITFGLAQVVAKVIYNTRELGASDGIIGIPIVDVPLGVSTVRADDPAGFFLVVLVLIGLIYLVLTYLAATPYGRLLAALRINQSRMPFLGWPTGPIKLGAFVLAAVIASLAGSLYPMLRGFVSPELMYFEVSTNAVVAVVIGGAGTLIGPLIGAVLLVFAKSIIGTVTEHHLIAIGALFMAAVIFFPQGLAGFIRAQLGSGTVKGQPGL